MGAGPVRWEPGEEEDDLPCTHCGGDGWCADGADPLGDCPDELHQRHIVVEGNPVRIVEYELS